MTPSSMGESAAGPRSVTSEQGAVYELARPLGRGGQGVVYATSDGRHAVKLLLDRSPAGAERLQRRLRFVRSQGDLLRQIPIARPLDLLRTPHLGYVMSLLGDTQPIKALLAPGDERGVQGWYLRGGGLRRRLRVLARAAEALRTLHGHCLAYVDLSPTNLLVSQDPAHHEIFLIDSDNLQHEDQPGAPGFYTPLFGAPELLRGRGAVNTLTDAHAFAVLAHYTLTLTHPLKGDLVNQGPPELEEQALLGQLPWIGDERDARNRSSTGLPADAVLSPGLRRLASQAFGAGLLDPSKRPGVAAWAEKLAAADFMTLCCPGCGWTFYAGAPLCPACDQPGPPWLLVRAARWEPAPPSGTQALPQVLSGLPMAALGLDDFPITLGGVEWQLVSRAPGTFDLRLRCADGRERLLGETGRADDRRLSERSTYVPLYPGVSSMLIRDTAEARAPHRVFTLQLEAGRP